MQSQTPNLALERTRRSRVFYLADVYAARQRRELPRPVMCPATGFHADQTGLQIGEEAQHVLALELLA